MTPDPPAPPVWLPAVAAVAAAVAVGVWGLVWRRKRAGRAALRRRAARTVPWGADGAALAGFFVFASVANAAAAATIPAEDAAAPEIDAAAALGYLAMWLMLSTAALVWLGARYRLRPCDMGAPRSPREGVADVPLGLAVGAAACLPVYGVQVAMVWGLGLPSTHPTVERLLADPSLETIASAAAMAVVVAPLFEELAFRALLQGWLQKVAGRNAWWPILASSLAFAAAHSGQGWAPVPLAVFALGLGYVYRQTHRLAPVVVAHAAFNAASLAVVIASAPTGAP